MSNTCSSSYALNVYSFINKFVKSILNDFKSPLGRGTGIPRFITLCFTEFCRYCIFHRLKVCGNPVSSKPIRAIFPTAFGHFVSLCHILVILAMFDTFSLFVMVICDQCSLMFLL